MSVFTTRPKGYKLGLASLALGFVFYVVGFACPFWTTFWVSFHVHYSEEGGSVEPASSGTTESTSTEQHYYYHDDYQYDYEHPFVKIEVRGHDGLWKSCSSSAQLSSVCVYFDQAQGAPGWIVATQGVQSVGLIAIVVSLVYSVVANWVKAFSCFTRITESAAALSCALGFIGCIVFASEVRRDIDKVEEQLKALGELENVQVEFNHLAWAFGVNVTGCCLILIGAISVFRYNQAEKKDLEVIGASFTNGACAEGSPAATAAASSECVGAVVTPQVLGEGGAVAVTASTPPTTQFYFIHPQQLAGRFCPPPYDPRQAGAGGRGEPGATGGVEACFDDMALSKGEKV